MANSPHKRLQMTHSMCLHWDQMVSITILFPPSKEFWIQLFGQAKRGLWFTHPFGILFVEYTVLPCKLNSQAHFPRGGGRDCKVRLVCVLCPNTILYFKFSPPPQLDYIKWKSAQYKISFQLRDIRRKVGVHIQDEYSEFQVQTQAQPP